VTARYDGIIVHSLHPSNISAEQGSETRCGRIGHRVKKLTPSASFRAGRPRKGRPRPFAEDQGLSAEWGERGIGGWGHSTRRYPFNAQTSPRFLSATPP
jgi:hypothetical protein